MANIRLDQVIDATTIVYDALGEVLRVATAPAISGVSVSGTPSGAGQVLTSTSTSAASWSSTGIVNPSGTITPGTIAVWASTTAIASGASTSTIVLTGDSRLTDARTPTAHASSHQVGGGDAISVAGLSGLLATAQTPTTHAASHQHGGADPIATATASANAIPKAGAGSTLDVAWIPVSTSSVSTAVVRADDARLSNARTPVAHASTHAVGGSDVLSVAGLTGLLATAQTPTAHKTTHQVGGSDEINVTGLTGLLATSQTPVAHHTSHEAGGGDQLSVAGLSGLLSTDQNATALRSATTLVSIGAATAPTSGQVLRATSSTAATWQTLAAGGDFVGPGSSVSGNVVTFSGTTGKLGADSGILATNIVLTGDSRLTNARTPTAHASTHQNGGGDEVGTATAAANAIPKAGAGGTLAIGWVPTANSASTSASFVPLCSDTRLSDDRTASGLRTATTVVAVSSATAPSAGQHLVATSSTAAQWQSVRQLQAGFTATNSAYVIPTGYQLIGAWARPGSDGGGGGGAGGAGGVGMGGGGGGGGGKAGGCAGMQYFPCFAPAGATLNIQIGAGGTGGSGAVFGGAGAGFGQVGGDTSVTDSTNARLVLRCARDNSAAASPGSNGTAGTGVANGTGGAAGTGGGTRWWYGTGGQSGIAGGNGGNSANGVTPSQQFCTAGFGNAPTSSYCTTSNGGAGGAVASAAGGGGGGGAGGHTYLGDEIYTVLGISIPPTSGAGSGKAGVGGAGGGGGNGVVGTAGTTGGAGQSGTLGRGGGGGAGGGGGGAGNSPAANGGSGGAGGNGSDGAVILILVQS